MENSNASFRGGIDDRNLTKPPVHEASVELLLQDARGWTIARKSAGFVELWS
jgi:hypothetical protein